eukprot:313301_1
MSSNKIRQFVYCSLLLMCIVCVVFVMVFPNDTLYSKGITISIQHNLYNKCNKMVIHFPLQSVNTSIKIMNKPLLFTISNYGFIGFAKNWILNLRKHKIFYYIIICTDIECFNELSLFNQNITKNIHNSSSIWFYNLCQTNRFIKFGESEYTNYVKQRPI